MNQSRRISLAAIILVILLLLFAPRPAAAQGGEGDGESATDEDSELIQILNVVDDGETVVLDVAVPSSGEGPAPSRANFGLTYNGSLVENFQLGSVTTGVDVIVVMDTSGSMAGQSMEQAKRAATSFLNRLPTNARVGLVGFGDTATVLNEPTTERSVVLNNINGMAAGGDTAIWDGLVEAANLSDTSGNALPYIVILSDGANDGSVATRQDAAAELSDAGAALFSVFIDSPSADGSELRATTEELNGIYVSADTDELQAMYERIADRLAGRYQVTFARPDQRRARVNVSALVDDTFAYAVTVLDGDDDVAAVADPERPARVLNVPTESQLGTVTAASPGPLGGAVMLPIGAAAMFFAIVLLGALVLNPAVDVRLEAASRADQVAGVKGRLTSAADHLVARRDSEGELNKALDAAGLHLRPGEFVLLATVSVVVCTLMAWLVGGLLLGVLVALLASFASLAYLARRASKQRELFADQLTDTLGILGGSLRAGRGLPQAMELVSAEAPSPTAEQFRRIGFEVQVGRDMTDSMLSVAERMKSQDFEWVAKAVAINRELGGDLTELLDRIADTIRERRRIARMVHAISAEGRASGWVLLSLPFFVFAFALWRTPESANLMFTTALGRIMLGVSLFGMVVGYFWIRKIVNFKY